jgi:PAS domain S-box-containing protein
MGISTARYDGRLIHANRAYARMYGYDSPSEMITEVSNVGQLYAHPEDRKEILRVLSEKGILEPSEVEVIRRDGTLFSVLVSAQEIRDVDGEILYYQANHIDITERKRAETTLLVNEHQMQALITSIDDIIFEFNERGIFLNVWTSNESLLASPRAETIGRSVSEVLGEEFARPFLESFKRVVATGRHEDIEYPLEVLSGRRWFLARINPVPALDGAAKTISMVVRDITERKRVEEELKKNEEKYRSIFENVQDVYYETLFDGTILEVSPSIEIISRGQYHRTDLIGRSMYEFYPNTAARDIILALMQKTGSVNDYEVQLKNRDGSFIFCSISAKTIFNTEGRPDKVIGSMHDISERKRAENALATGEIKYRAFFENSMDAIFLTTPDGRILSANQAACRMFDYSEDEFIKTDKTRLVDPNDQNLVKLLSERELHGWVQGELTFIRKDGTHFPADISSAFFKSDNGEMRASMIIHDITERKRVEEELNLAHIELKNLHDTLEEAIFSFDVVKNKMLQVSVAHEAVYGYSTNEFFKNPHLWYELVLPEDRPIVDAGFVVLKSGKNHQHEVRIVHIDGHIRWIEARMKPTLDQNGRLIHIDGIVTNITERKLAEEELRETHDYLENLLSFANAPIMVWDNKNKITRFNLALERMTGYTVYDVLGRNPEILFPDEKRKEISTLISRTADGENLISVELPIRCKNGIIRNVLWNTSNIYTKDAKTIIATIANGQDVTERKQTEEALQESELRFRSLYENATIGIYRTTHDGKILMANPALVKMLGYTSFQNLTERNLEKDGFDAPSHRKEFLEMIERDGEVHSFDSKWIHQDGKVIFVLESARAIRDSQGKTLYYDGTVEDITERRQLEEGLRQIQKLEGLGTLAGGIAHDFNNILGIILAYITSTRRYKDDAKKLDLAVDTIVKAVERGKTLVQQILTFARKTETEFGPVKVNDVVMEVMVMIFETFPKILTYAQNFDKSISYINADRSQLHQLLLNLCVNARDAMPNGGLLTINTRMVSVASLRHQHPDAAESDYVCIEVCDTGEGMTPETRGRIFEPFFTTKEMGKGTGLGLAVVFGVVQTHKGFIDVESELGKGTTFSIYLPASKAVESISVKDEERLEEIQGGTETLLVVEDEEMLLMSLQMILSEKGYKVISAGDGLAAVNIYKERKKEIALVLTDLGLPKMSGKEECAQIKKINPRARMIVATGYLDTGMKSEFMKTGIQHFLFKPYDLKQVLKVIREVLDEK